MQIYRVDSVVVIKDTGSSRLTILANGTSSTPGWSNPHLDGSGDPNPADAIAELSFEATRPDGIVPQILVPISASHLLTSQSPIDAVIITARTNSITVHASEFQTAPELTTMALGEENPPSTMLSGEEQPTTLALGEEEFTTHRFGEEGGTTLMLGEEGPTTKMLGEEGLPTTLRLGEEGPITDPRVDDPAPNFPQAPRWPRWPEGPGPFGGF